MDVPSSPLHEELLQQEKLLRTYLETLRHYEHQQALFGPGHVPNHVISGFEEAKSHVKRLRSRIRVLKAEIGLADHNEELEATLEELLSQMLALRTILEPLAASNGLRDMLDAHIGNYVQTLSGLIQDSHRGLTDGIGRISDAISQANAITPENIKRVKVVRAIGYNDLRRRYVENRRWSEVKQRWNPTGKIAFSYVHPWHSGKQDSIRVHFHNDYYELIHQIEFQTTNHAADAEWSKDGTKIYLYTAADAVETLRGRGLPTFDIQDIFILAIE